MTPPPHTHTPTPPTTTTSPTKNVGERSFLPLGPGVRMLWGKLPGAGCSHLRSGKCRRWRWGRRRSRSSLPLSLGLLLCTTQRDTSLTLQPPPHQHRLKALATPDRYFSLQTYREPFHHLPSCQTKWILELLCSTPPTPLPRPIPKTGKGQKKKKKKKRYSFYFDHITLNVCTVARVWNVLQFS